MRRNGEFVLILPLHLVAVRIVNVGKVEFSKSGKIGPLEKYVRIPIVVR